MFACHVSDGFLPITRPLTVAYSRERFNMLRSPGSAQGRSSGSIEAAAPAAGFSPQRRFFGERQSQLARSLSSTGAGNDSYVDIHCGRGSNGNNLSMCFVGGKKL